MAKPQVHTINSTPASGYSSQALTKTLTAAEQKQLGIMLMRLASHYWRPDFSPNQVNEMLADYAADLGSCDLTEIEIAIAEYRRTPVTPGRLKVFPGSDILLALVLAHRKHRADLEKLGPPIKEFDSRPICWWMQPKTLWQPHWRESEVPAGEFIRETSDGARRHAKAS